MTNPTAGADALIKHVQGYFASSNRTRYQAVKVTRVTKARVFVRESPDHQEREFRLDNLLEYGEKAHRADQLIVDPALVAQAVAEQAAAEERRKKEVEGLAALADVVKRFEHPSIHLCSVGEIELLIAFRDGFRVPGVSENVGPTP